MIFVAGLEVEIPQWDPARLAAPAHVDDLSAVGE